MRNHVNQLLKQFSFCLLLLLSTGTVFGQLNGQEKTASRIDTIGLPKRITYLQENGVFLNENQEKITLEKLLWKEQYRQDAVSMYWVNKALEERINQLLAVNKEYKADLQLCETSSITAVSNMEHYKNLYKDIQLQNDKLRKDNGNLKTSIKVYKITAISLTGLFVAYGIISIF